MEYVYAALILHESGTEVDQANLTNVLEAAEIDVEETRVKALVAALEDVDIEEAIEQPMGPVVAGPAAAGAPEEQKAAEEEAEQEAEKEPEKKEEGTAEEGLGQLFG